jgi:hypothetical protein
MKKLIVLSILILVVLLCVAYLDRYEYFKLGHGDGVEFEVRTNRFTDETDVLSVAGWRVVQTPKQWADEHWNKTHPLPYPMIPLSGN